MDEYFIGAGALLTAGPAATIAGATLHAQTEGVLAGEVVAAVVDFESASVDQVSRLLIVAAGWDGSRFNAEVVSRLLAQRECGLTDVIATLADAVGVDRVHIFAHWQPERTTVDALRGKGITVIAHSLDAIGRAALVSGQRVALWPAKVRAA
ncbi:MAG: hypothetical protein WAK16_02010 [Candidatus Cybelea sp.]